MRLRLSTALALLLASAPVPCRAFTESIEHNGARVSVSGPDWIWQGRTVNVIATARNTSPNDRTVTIRLLCPDAHTNSFALPAVLSAGNTVPAGATVKMAVTGIVPKKSAERRTYPLSIELNIGETRQAFPYPLKVIRGSLVESPKWSILLPTLVGLLWSICFALILPRFSGKGAWKTIGSAVEEPEEKERWYANE